MSRGAWLFDLDGTLIDSMPLHGVAWERWHAQVGLPYDADAFFHATAGRTADEIIADLLPQLNAEERERMAEDKEALYRDEARRSLRMVAGFDGLHAHAKAQGLALAICTAAPLGNIDVACERFGLRERFDVIVSPADGLRGKPHPDIFEEAARRLGVTAEHCVVFEDAPLGVEAARRAGMRAVALTTTLSAEHFSHFPNLVATVPDLAAVELTLL